MPSNSYPQTYPQAHVDDATHRSQSLTQCQDSSLYLKDIKLLKIKINKKKINIKIKNKNLLAIPMSIIILTVSMTVEAKAATQTDLLKLYAHSRLVSMEQFKCFDSLIHKESSWRVNARNESHYGLGQMKSTWYKDLTPRQQIKAHLRYIDHRYDGKPCKAYKHWAKYGWH